MYNVSFFAVYGPFNIIIFISIECSAHNISEASVTGFYLSRCLSHTRSHQPTPSPAQVAWSQHKQVSTGIFRLKTENWKFSLIDFRQKINHVWLESGAQVRIRWWGKKNSILLKLDIFFPQASGTFIGYITGTVKLVFIVFFIFLLLSAMTAMLMGYSRYMARRPQKPGFFNPPKLQFKQQKQSDSEPMKTSGQSTVLWKDDIKLPKWIMYSW